MFLPICQVVQTSQWYQWQLSWYYLPLSNQQSATVAGREETVWANQGLFPVINNHMPVTLRTGKQTWVHVVKLKISQHKRDLPWTQTKTNKQKSGYTVTCFPRFWELFMYFSHIIHTGTRKSAILNKEWCTLALCIGISVVRYYMSHHQCKYPTVCRYVDTFFCFCLQLSDKLFESIKMNS